VVIRAEGQTADLVADIEAIRESWEAGNPDTCALLAEAMHCLSQCRAALIARDGIWASWPAPYRDQEADAMPCDPRR
jgi:hypothetical protein